MKDNIVLTFLILCVIGSTLYVRAVFAQDRVDLLWKARALQAIEKIEKSVERMGDQSEKVTLKEKYEAMLEFAYAQIVAEPNIVVKKSRGVTSYHLIFNYGDNGMLDVLYTYDNESNLCKFMSVDSLPKRRRIAIPVTQRFSDIIFITNPSDPNEPGFAFHRSNPFLTQVIDHKGKYLE